MLWTPENIDRLRELWANDASGSAIAADLGTTRSSVIAKAARLGLPGRTPTTYQRAARKKKSKSHHPWTSAVSAQGKIGSQSPDVAQTNDAPVGGVTLLNLEWHMCRWPIGDPRSDDFRFCGCQKVQGRSYCEAHLRMAFQPIRPRVDVRPLKRESA